jgi:hypothetical protein
MCPAVQFKCLSRLNDFTRTERTNMSNDPDEVITVYTAANPLEAHFVKNLLLDSDIRATVAEDHEPLAGLSIVPPDVMVRRGDAASAEAVIAEYEEKKRERADDPEWTCPQCGESMPAVFDECFQCGVERPGSPYR